VGYKVTSKNLYKGNVSKFLKRSNEMKKKFGIPYKGTIWSYGLKKMIKNRFRWPSSSKIHEEKFPWIDEEFTKEYSVERKKVSRNIDNEYKRPREEHWESLTSGIWQWSLEALNSIAAHRCCEARSPFLDRRVVELSLSIPLKQKLKDGWPRAILRHSMDGILPKPIQWRTTKGNMNPAFIHSIINEGREEIESFVKGEDSDVENYIDFHILRKMYTKFCESPSLHREEKFYPIYKSLIINYWIKEAKNTTT